MSKLDSEGSVIAIKSKQLMEMLPRNTIQAYTTKVKPEMHLFTLIYASIDECLPQISQLYRASTLSASDQASMIAAIVHSRQCRIKFDACWLEHFNEETVLEKRGNRITPLVTNPGRLLLTNRRLYFQPFNNADTYPVLKISFGHVKRVVKRRFLLRQIGIELYFSKDFEMSYLFLSLISEQERDEFYDALIAQPDIQLDSIEQENMMLKWQNRLISNFDYLLYLNSMADRSFNDLAQYPVFPWVIADYTSPTLDLLDPKTFRDLRKPMGALNENRLKNLKERYRDMSEPKFLYGSHYSTPAFVLFYIVRKVPQYMLCLQNGRFDQPERMFNSLFDTWKNVTTNQTDFKEMIPEFYQLENKGDFLTNTMNVDFGVTQNGKKIDDVRLPPWAKHPEDFIQKMRAALESDYVSENLHHWIDLIFGYKQSGKEAEAADNVFYYLTYEGAVDLESVHDINKRDSLEVQIMEFGQIPRQLFHQPHPARTSSAISERKESVHKSPDFQIESSDLREINPNAMETEFTFQLHKDTVKAVCFSEDGKRLFSVSQDCLLKLYSLEDKEQQRSIPISKMALSSLILTPGDKSALIGSWDNHVYTYNFEYGKTTSDIEAHDDAVTDTIWTENILITSSWDSTVKVWNYRCETVVRRSFDLLLKSLDHDDRVNCISYNTSSSSLLSGTDDGKLHLWDLNKTQLLAQFAVSDGAVNDVEFSDDGHHFICCGNDLKMFDVRTRSQVFRVTAGQELTCLKWAGTSILTGGSEGSLMLWDLMNGKLLKNVSGHKGAISCINISPCSRLASTGGYEIWL